MIRINGQDFIRKILEGERYFVGMILEDNFNLNASPDFAELQRYLLKQKFWSKPMIFSHSDFRKLTASGIYLPYLQAEYANFEEANLENAILLGANFERAKLKGVKLKRANLQVANLKHARLSRANLSSSNLRGSNLCRANLKNANLRNSVFEEVRMANATLANTDAQNTNFKHATLTHANLQD